MPQYKLVVRAAAEAATDEIVASAYNFMYASHEKLSSSHKSPFTFVFIFLWVFFIDNLMASLFFAVHQLFSKQKDGERSRTLNALKVNRTKNGEQPKNGRKEDRNGWRENRKDCCPRCCAVSIHRLCCMVRVMKHYLCTRIPFPNRAVLSIFCILNLYHFQF